MVENKRLALWGGLECTVARIGDAFRDQFIETGHENRLDDLDAIAALGIRTLRYPVLWENVTREGAQIWDRHDARLDRLQRLGIQPIAGLVHHGSGPLHTNLLDPGFAEGLARHAGHVAERYPWIEAYTPVNEPLTTARFSAFYGHWYPHERDYGAFLRALANQCRATLLAMRAIRRVRPDARLVQTEDLGKTFSTPTLRYQVEHENDRRWLTYDLLMGRVDREHPMRGWLTYLGVPERDLDEFLDGEAAPDVIGVNHYLTSERYLDHRHRDYPEHLRGGNGRHAYADVEAVRLDHLPADDIGPAARLRETWARYGRPIAITEVHHGCTRDEQLRWFLEVWRAAETVRAEGADIRAVTLWAMLGAVDWNSLLTRRDGIYEPGAFDVRGPAPRQTALARAAADLVRTGTHDHPVLDQPGWWHGADRHYVPGGRRRAQNVATLQRRLLILDAGGVLGEELVRMCRRRGLAHVALQGGALDRADPAAIRAAIIRHRPWALVDCAGVSVLEEGPCGSSPRDPAPSAKAVASAAAEAGVPLLAFSPAIAFDGGAGRPYLESSVASSNPDGAAAAERRVAEACPGALIVRVGPLFGPSDRRNVLVDALDAMASGRRVVLGDGRLVSPTYTPDLVHNALDLLIDGATGLWHLANGGATTLHAFVERAAREVGLDAGLLLRGEEPEASFALASERGELMPSLDSALHRFLAERGGAWRDRDRQVAAGE